MKNKLFALFIILISCFIWFTCLRNLIPFSVFFSCFSFIFLKKNLPSSNIKFYLFTLMIFYYFIFFLLSLREVEAGNLYFFVWLWFAFVILSSLNILIHIYIFDLFYVHIFSLYLPGKGTIFSFVWSIYLFGSKYCTRWYW